MWIVEDETLEVTKSYATRDFVPYTHLLIFSFQTLQRVQSSCTTYRNHTSTEHEIGRNQILPISEVQIAKVWSWTLMLFALQLLLLELLKMVCLRKLNCSDSGSRRGRFHQSPKTLYLQNELPHLFGLQCNLWSCPLYTSSAWRSCVGPFCYSLSWVIHIQRKKKVQRSSYAF